MPKKQPSAEKRVYHRGAAVSAADPRAALLSMCPRSEGPFPVRCRGCLSLLPHHQACTHCPAAAAAQVNADPPPQVQPLPGAAPGGQQHASHEQAVSRLQGALPHRGVLLPPKIQTKTVPAELHVADLVTRCCARLLTAEDPPGGGCTMSDERTHTAQVRCCPCTPPCISCHQQAAPCLQGLMPCQGVVLHKVAHSALHVSAACHGLSRCWHACCKPYCSKGCFGSIRSAVPGKEHRLFRHLAFMA